MKEKIVKRDEVPHWGALIPAEQWRVFQQAIKAVRQAGVRFLIGGAFGLASYIDRCRNTKDLDFFVLSSEKDRVIDALTKAGFEDFFEKSPYERGWIFRATKDEVIVDTIWQTPNRRSQVDDLWFERARDLVLMGEPLKIIPAEELLCIKLYVLQRDRCDWPDLLNLLHATCDQLDWEHVLRRMNSDAPLLGGLLQIFNWIAPARALTLPAWVRKEFCLREPTSEELALDPHVRVQVLDSRAWYAAFQPEDQPMQI
jgi:hypothetical protein